MRFFEYILLALAVAGTIGSTVFLGLALVAARRYRRMARLQQSPWQGEWPRVSVIKPVHGPEPRLRENLESFFQQVYPPSIAVDLSPAPAAGSTTPEGGDLTKGFELLFCARHRDDAALAAVDELREKYPQVDCRVMTCGEPPYPNAKVLSLTTMLAAAKNDYLVMSDSDVLAAPGYLREVTRPLLEKENGMVTCIYRGVPTGGFWSGLEALGMSVEMTSGVIIAAMLEGMNFALGPTIAMRRDALDAIGGVEHLKDYCAEDFVMGELTSKRGYDVVLSSHAVGHMAGAYGFVQSWKHQVRWMLSARFSRPAGHFGMGITFAMPFGILGWLGCAALGHPLVGLAFFAWAFANRMVQCVVVGGAVVKDERCMRLFWLYPLRDLLGFCVWVASYAGNEVLWRGEKYELIEDGKMIRKMETESTGNAMGRG